MRGAAGDQAAQEEGWVICRVFKKKNLVHQGQSSGGGTAASNKTVAAAAPTTMESSPTSNGSSSVTMSDHHVKAHQMLHSSASDDALDHILQYMTRSSSSSSCHNNNNNNKQDTKPALLDHHPHHHLAAAACPGSSSFYGKFMKLPPLEHVGGGLLPNPSAAEYDASGIADWDSLDRLAAYELNGLADASKSNMASFFDEPTSGAAAHAGVGDGDLWSLARSVSSLHADLTMN